MTETSNAIRPAPAPAAPVHHGQITLINSFAVPAGRDDAFLTSWRETSSYFRARPGFISLRLHRSMFPKAQYRFVNVAIWAGLEQFQAAHATAEFRALVGQPKWREFPSTPTLYEAAIELTGE